MSIKELDSSMMDAKEFNETGISGEFIEAGGCSTPPPPKPIPQPCGTPPCSCTRPACRVVTIEGEPAV